LQGLLELTEAQNPYDQFNVEGFGIGVTSASGFLGKALVEDSQTLQRALGDGVKRVELNELDSQIAQRRALRCRLSFTAGHVLRCEDLISLRPAPPDSLAPNQLDLVIGKRLRAGVAEQQIISMSDFA
jgi:sialic acid synthase SpsE